MEFNYVIEQYIHAAEDYGNSLRSGNHVVANESHDVIQKLSRKLIESGRSEEIMALLEDGRIAVRYCAAVDALKIMPERGKAVLETIVNNSSGPIRLMAQVSLSEWLKRGGQR
jgi:hypothetical protein